MDTKRGLFDRWWSIEGRATSTQYAAWIGLYWVAAFVSSADPTGIVLVPVVLVGSWAMWTAAVRRGHDMGKSAWFTAVVLMLPSVASSAIMVFAMAAMIVARSTSGMGETIVLAMGVLMVGFMAHLWYLCANGDDFENDYGEDPRSVLAIRRDPHRRSDAVVGRIVAAVIVVMTVLAAGVFLMLGSAIAAAAGGL